MPETLPVDERLDRLEAAIAQLATDFYAMSGSGVAASAAANSALVALMAMVQPTEPELGDPLPRWGGV
jgi:hypothetical protein